MEGETLDSAEYESTYLELRPVCERLSDATLAPMLARIHADAQADERGRPLLRRRDQQPERCPVREPLNGLAELCRSSVE